MHKSESGYSLDPLALLLSQCGERTVVGRGRVHRAYYYGRMQTSREMATDEDT